jgi:hypothetical protein
LHVKDQTYRTWPWSIPENTPISYLLSKYNLQQVGPNYSLMLMTEEDIIMYN